MVFENFLLPQKTSKYNLVQGQNLMTQRNNNSYSNFNSPTVFRENFDVSNAKVNIIAGKRIHAENTDGNRDVKDLDYKVRMQNDKPDDFFIKQQKQLEAEKVKFAAKYGDNVTSYSTNAKKTINDHLKYKKQLGGCIGKCDANYGAGDDADTEKNKSCKVGCHLKGTFIRTCSNKKKVNEITINGESLEKHFASKNHYCSHLSSVDVKKCKGTDAYGDGGAVIDNTISNLAKDGCCSCGGGHKKRRITSTELNSLTDDEFYENCNQTKHKNICENAKLYVMNDQGEQTSQVDNGAITFQSKQYADLVNSNSKLRTNLDELNINLNKLTKQESSLVKALEEEKEMGGTKGDDNSSSLYNQYRIKQEELEKVLGKFGRRDMMGNTIVDPSLEKNHKLIGLNEDILLKLNSEKIKFAFWSVLALVLGIATITSFNKKIE